MSDADDMKSPNSLIERNPSEESETPIKRKRGRPKKVVVEVCTKQASTLCHSVVYHMTKCSLSDSRVKLPFICCMLFCSVKQQKPTEENTDNPVVKRKRGRPKGSKNKNPKVSPSVVV